MAKQLQFGCHMRMCLNVCHLASGAETVMQMGELVKKGVDVYLLRSMPVIFTVVMVVAAAAQPPITNLVWVLSASPTLGDVTTQRLRPPKAS